MTVRLQWQWTYIIDNLRQFSSCFVQSTNGNEVFNITLTILRAQLWCGCVCCVSVLCDGVCCVRVCASLWETSYTLEQPSPGCHDSSQTWDIAATLSCVVWEVEPSGHDQRSSSYAWSYTAPSETGSTPAKYEASAQRSKKDAVMMG